MNRIFYILCFAMCSSTVLSQEAAPIQEFEDAVSELRRQAENRQREIEKIFDREVEKLRAQLLKKLASRRVEVTKEGNLDEALEIRELEDQFSDLSVEINDEKQSQLSVEQPAEPESDSNSRYEVFRWKQGDPPLRMLREADGICFLSGVKADSFGGEAVLRVAEDGWWYLSGELKENTQPITLEAIALPYEYLEENYTLKDVVGDYKWFNGTPVSLLTDGTWIQRKYGYRGTWRFDNRTKTVFIISSKGVVTDRARLMAGGRLLFGRQVSGRFEGQIMWGVKSVE